MERKQIFGTEFLKITNFFLQKDIKLKVKFTVKR